MPANRPRTQLTLPPKYDHIPKGVLSGMKMKLLDRLILRFGALFTLLTGAATAAAGFLLLGRELGEGDILKYLPLILIICGGVSVIISALIYLVARRYAVRRRAFVTQPTELGELRIAVSAIENLIEKCLETHKEVKVQEMNVVNRRGAIDVDLRVAMNSNVSIPHAIEQLQTQIKRYLAASSGIEVRNISVSVDKTPSGAVLPEDTAEEPAEEAYAPADEKEKIPLHQRIFGRDPEKSETEQITEAEYVQPPEPEEEVPDETAADDESAEDSEKVSEEDGRMSEQAGDRETEAKKEEAADTDAVDQA